MLEGYVRRRNARKGLLPFFFAAPSALNDALLSSFETPNFFFSTFAAATSYGVELITALLPELTLVAIIIYLIHAIGVELGWGRPKKALAIETLAASQEALG